MKQGGALLSNQDFIGFSKAGLDATGQQASQAKEGQRMDSYFINLQAKELKQTLLDQVEQQIESEEEKMEVDEDEEYVINHKLQQAGLSLNQNVATYSQQ